MILARVLTGLTLIVAVYLVVFHSPRLIFFLLVLAAIFLSLREFYQLVIPEAAFLGKLVGTLLALGMATLIYLDQYSLAVNILALGIILLATINMAGSGDLMAALANTGLIVLGTLYAGLLLTFLIVIRNSNQGQELVFLVFLLTWAQDVAAFFAGRAWGSRKLYPRLSPGKTWEGFLAGLLLSALLAVASQPFLVRELSLLVRLFLGLGAWVRRVGCWGSCSPRSPWCASSQIMPRPYSCSPSPSRRLPSWERITVHSLSEWPLRPRRRF